MATAPQSSGWPRRAPSPSVAGTVGGLGLPRKRIIVPSKSRQAACLEHRAPVAGDPAGCQCIHRAARAAASALMQQCGRRVNVFACRPGAGSSPDGPGQDLSGESPTRRRHDGALGGWEDVGAGARAGMAVITGRPRGAVMSQGHPGGQTARARLRVGSPFLDFPGRI
jgi:hypothetical protein